MKGQTFRRFGALVFDLGDTAECIRELGKPLEMGKVRLHAIACTYDEFIVQFSESIKQRNEATRLPGCQASINGFEVTGDQAFLKAICRGVGQGFDVDGFLGWPGLGIAVTGIHDDDPSQLAITLFEKQAWDELIAKREVDNLGIL